jgi:hypothetical protein
VIAARVLAVPLLLAAVLTGFPAVGQVLSPRLAAMLAHKDLEPVAVEIWTRPGAAAPVGAAEIEPDHYLGAYAPGRIADLSVSGSVAYVAPADPIVAPDGLDNQADSAGADPAEKGLMPKALVAWPAGTGAGVTIGVIDFGEPPADAGIALRRDFGRPGASPHSGRVLAILRRLAPDARLVVAALSPASTTAGDLQRAAAWLELQGARVITFSGATYTNRRDGLAPIDRLVDAQVARGIVWVAASGNAAQRSWTGLTVDRDRDGAVDIAAGQNTVTLQAHGPVDLALTWDDWGERGPPHGNWDIDLVVTDDHGRVVAADRTRRGAIGEPVRTLHLSDLAAGHYHIAMPLRGGGAPVGVRLVATGQADFLSPAIAYASIGNPATAHGVITVAAVDPRHDVTAPYSGQGPTADRRAKPELGASGAGGGGSVGTSYAAPRVAAIAACVLSRHLEWTPDQVKAALGGYTQPLERRSVLGEAPRWIDTRAHDSP